MAGQSSKKQANGGSPKNGRSTRPWLEWLASGIGLTLALVGIGLLIWNGLTASDAPPRVEVQLQRVIPSGDGYVAEVIATNHTDTTAATVTVQGELKQNGQTVETSQTQFGYVPGQARRNGGLYFRQDPRRFTLELRALGYIRP